MTKSDPERLDPTDELLIDQLKQNARISTAALGRILGLSRTTVQSRLERLERRGIITGYTVNLGHGRDPRRIRAHVMIKLDPKASAEVVSQLRDLRPLKSLYAISGEFDMIGVLAVQTTEEIDQALDYIGTIKGINRTETSILLSTKWEK